MFSICAKVRSLCDVVIISKPARVTHPYAVLDVLKSCGDCDRKQTVWGRGAERNEVCIFEMGATGGSSASANRITYENTGGQAASGTRYIWHGG